MSIGAFIENLLITAGTMGLAADIRVIAHSPHERDVVRIELREQEPADYPLARIKNRRTVKHGYRSDDLQKAHLKLLTSQSGGELYYFPSGSKHATCIRELAIENFRIQTARDDAQQELVRWMRIDNREAFQYRDGLSTEGMEIHGLKGWFVRYFVKPEDFMKTSYRRQSVDIIFELAQQGGGWLILTSKGQTVPDLIETGRRFERMALIARELRIGIHPMTQILEEKSGISEIAAHHDNSFFLNLSCGWAISRSTGTGESAQAC